MILLFFNSFVFKPAFSKNMAAGIITGDMSPFIQLGQWDMN